MVEFNEMPSPPSQQVPIDSRGHQETMVKGADIKQAEDSPHEHANSGGKQTPKFGSPMTKRSRRKVGFVSKLSPKQQSQGLSKIQVGGKNEPNLFLPLRGDTDILQQENDDEIDPLNQHVRSIHPKVARQAYFGEQDSGKFDEGVKLTEKEIICIQVEYRLTSKWSHFKRETESEIQQTKGQWNNRFSALCQEVMNGFSAINYKFQEKMTEFQEKLGRLVKPAIQSTKSDKNIQTDEGLLEYEEEQQYQEEPQHPEGELFPNEVKPKRRKVEDVPVVVSEKKDDIKSFHLSKPQATKFGSKK